MLMPTAARREGDGGAIIGVAHRGAAHSPIAIPECAHMECARRRLRIWIVRVGVESHLAVALEVGIVMERRRLSVDVAHPRAASRSTRYRSHGQPRARSTGHGRNTTITMHVASTRARIKVVIIIVQRRSVEPGRSKGRGHCCVMFEPLRASPPPHSEEDPEEDGCSSETNENEDTCYCPCIPEEAREKEF